MKQYILPEGFRPRSEYVHNKYDYKVITAIFANGRTTVVDNPNWYGFDDLTSPNPWVGFKFVEPLKVKERYEVFRCRFGWIVREQKTQLVEAHHIPTREAAERIKDIYEEGT